VTHFAKIR